MLRYCSVSMAQTLDVRMSRHYDVEMPNYRGVAVFCCCDGVVVQRRAAVVLSFCNVVVSRWSSIAMAQHRYVVTL
jgi:hypothetical protein